MNIIMDPSCSWSHIILASQQEVILLFWRLYQLIIDQPLYSVVNVVATHMTPIISWRRYWLLKHLYEQQK